MTAERVLVAAPYPTMRGVAAEATFELVRSLVDDGSDVLVASPRPSAAHVVADPGGPRGAAKLASLAAGCDRLIVRLDAAGLRADADPLFALPGRLGLAAALRRVGRADVILDRVPQQLSRRWVSLVLAPAASISVSTDAERDTLVDAGVDASKVAIHPAAQDATHAHDGRSLAPERGEGTFEERMRARAAAVSSPAEGDASRPLRHVVPLERPAIRSRKPGVAAVKRVQLRLLAWMFDSVIQHVNRLHHATIESIELLDVQPKSTR